MRASTRLLALPLLMSLPATARAQEILLEYQANGSTYVFDSGVDVDGDGTTDLLAGGSPDGIEQVSILSGATGLPLLELIDPIDDPGFPVLYDASFLDDLDGDGRPDFVVAATPADLLYFSSRDGTLIEQLPLPRIDGNILFTRVERLADFDGDLLDDVVLLQTSFTAGATMHAVSSGNRALLWELDFDHFPVALSSVPDQDHDGIDDLLLPAETFDEVQLRSGADGAELGRFSTSARTVEDLQRIPDVDQDGTDDVLVGPALQIFSGADLGEIVDLEIELPTTVVSTSLFFTQDVNGDGWNDLGLGAIERPVHGGQLRTDLLISGKTLELLDRAELDPVGSLLAVAGAGDIDGDGLADIVESITEESGVVLRVRAGRELYLHTTHAMPTAGTRIALRLSEGTPGDLAAMVISAVNELPFTRLYALARLDATGALVRRPTVPPGLAGLSVDFTGYAEWPDGFRASDPERLELR